VNLTAFWSKGSPAIMFSANAYDNTTLQGRYGYINADGWAFTDGNSQGDTITCGVNNLGFYLPNAGYFITGQRYNERISASPSYTASDMIFYPNNGGNVCFIQLSGSGTRSVSAGANGVLFISGSDERLKKNKTTLSPVLEKLVALNPITYKWDENSDMKKHPAFDDEIQYGFTAQNIQSQFSDLVYELKISDKIYYGYDERKLFPILVKGIQEQQTKIVSLEEQLALLKATVDALIASSTSGPTGSTGPSGSV
jgi:hypothetical protein